MTVIKYKHYMYISRIHIYTSDILMNSAACTIYRAGVGKHSFTVLSALGRIQCICCSYSQSLQFEILFFSSGTHHHCWVDRGSREWEVCLTLLHMTSNGSWTWDHLILSPMPYPLSKMFPNLWDKPDIASNQKLFANLTSFFLSGSESSA